MVAGGNSVAMRIDDADLLESLRELGLRHGFGCGALVTRNGEDGGPLILVTLKKLGGKAAAAPAFTPAEREVLKWLRLGRTNRDIGRILFKSEYTVKTHVQRMLQKAGLDNRVQLAAIPYA